MDPRHWKKCKIEVPWVPQDTRDVKIMGYLLIEDANRKQKQPKRKEVVGDNKDELEIRRALLHQTCSFRFCSSASMFWSCLVLYFLTIIFWNGNIHPVTFKICGLLFDFLL